MVAPIPSQAYEEVSEMETCCLRYRESIFVKQQARWALKASLSDRSAAAFLSNTRSLT